MRTSTSVSRRPAATSTRALVYERIRDAIVSLELPPGSRISDVRLAETMGLSRTPVREALLQLASEGLVEMLPQHGTYVARISLDAVREAQFIREALELAALRAAVEKIGPDGLAALERNVAEQREAEAAGDVERFYRLDDDFHRLLLAASGHPGVARVAEQSRAHLNRVRWLSLPTTQLIGQTLIPHHAELLERVRARDAEGAERVLRDHLRLILRDLPEFARRHPDYFESEQAPGGSLGDSVIVRDEEAHG